MVEALKHLTPCPIESGIEFGRDCRLDQSLEATVFQLQQQPKRCSLCPPETQPRCNSLESPPSVGLRTALDRPVRKNPPLDPTSR